MHSVTITGFTTPEEAEEFMAWYSDQGEQDLGTCLECRRNDDPEFKATFMGCKKYEMIDGNGVMEIRVSKE